MSNNKLTVHKVKQFNLLLKAKAHWTISFYLQCHCRLTQYYECWLGKHL